MSTTKQSTDIAQFTVKNIGGIDETDVKIPPGITVLTGNNASNRTSFLYAIMTAMGSRQANLKGDADQGYVKMNLEDEVYKRELNRSGDDIQFSGTGYLDDVNVAELFAFLHETNEARQAVARGDDLHEVIMRPVDTQEIEREIKNLEQQKRDIDKKLDRVESKKQQLTELEQRRDNLEEKIEDKKQELEIKEEEIEETGQNIEESRESKEELETKFEALRSIRSELESIRRKIESQEDSINSLKKERNELRDELKEFSDTPTKDHEYLENEIERLQHQYQMLNNEISKLQSTIEYNEDQLDNENYKLLNGFDKEEQESSESITDDLLPDGETITCWTCGSTVEKSQIENTVDQLKNVRKRKMDKRNEIKNDLEDIKQQQKEYEEKKRRQKEIKNTIDDINDEIDRREDQLESLKKRKEGSINKIEKYEKEINELETKEFNRVLELQKEANQLEFEIEDIESELEEVTNEIQEIESLINRSDDLQEKKEDLKTELENQRTKIKQIEQEAVDEFNNHMASILDILSYENLERIWIERIQREVRKGRKKAEQTFFEIHVVRTTENGTTYEDKIDHLSESEREVTGLVFALAGYLVHELYDTVPFMLLDSLEAIDSDRIAQLIEYFADYADYLVVALLPEDTQAIDEDINRITSI